MYIAVHRVQREEDGDCREGVNGFLHLHPGLAWPELSSDILSLPSREPGEVRCRILGLEPVGGNRVQCYLDLILPDDRSDLIEPLIQRVRAELQETPPIVIIEQPGAAIFGCELGSLKSREAWFEALVQNVRGLRHWVQGTRERSG